MELDDIVLWTYFGMLLLYFGETPILLFFSGINGDVYFNIVRDAAPKTTKSGWIHLYGLLKHHYQYIKKYYILCLGWWLTTTLMAYALNMNTRRGPLSSSSSSTSTYSSLLTTEIHFHICIKNLLFLCDSIPFSPIPPYLQCSSSSSKSFY